MKTHKAQPSSEMGFMDALSRAIAVFAKDVTTEFRTRYALNAILLFAVMTLIAVSFSIGGIGLEKPIQASLLWIIIYFSAMSGLSRTFVHEEDAKTASALRLAAPPGAVFGGKLLFNYILLFVLELVIVPLFVGMMDLHVSGWPLFIAILIFGSAGLAVASTMVAAIVSRANARGALFAVLAFPLILPLLITAIRGTQAALGSAVFAAGTEELKLLVSYTGIELVISFLIFKFVWED